MKKFHEKGIRLVQMSPSGIWHGYIGCMLQETFPNEEAALRWLNL